MRALAKVLYEDRLAAETSQFALHVLVRRCILDELGWTDERWSDLEDLVVGQARNGDTKLLAACENAREARGFRHVFVVLDDDKIRRRLGLAHDACTTQVRTAILRRSPYPEQLHVILLRRNMESVVAAVEGCRGRPAPDKLKPLQRDNVLASIAWRPDFASQRACVLDAVPSLRYLVDKLASVVRTASP